MFDRRVGAIRIPHPVFLVLGLILICSAGWTDQIDTLNFTSNTDFAKYLGVHEVILTGDNTSENPFDTVATVTFVPPSGDENAKRVYLFYDGYNIWRARVYVNEIGDWTWTSESQDDAGLDGKTGHFTALNPTCRGC